ncbi:DUF4347 domain-containing protein, partial [Dokdonia ponticola]
MPQRKNRNNLLVLIYLITLSISHASTNFKDIKSESKHSIIYVDNDLPDRYILENAVTSTNATEVHLFSHGRPGELYIKGQWLQKEQIAHFIQSEFGFNDNSQSSMVNRQSINIYGCEFAKGQKGKEAVNYLEKELGISIAASTNITGKDGDWELEVGQTSKNLNLQEYNYNLQLDTVHYFPPHVGASYLPANFDNEYLYLSTPSITNISVVVTDGGGTPIPGSPFTISNASPAEIVLGTNPPNAPISVDRALLGSPMSNVGLRASSASLFYAEYRQLSNSQGASLSAKGTVAVGTNFKWAGARSFQGEDFINNYLSILAIEDTNVNISGINPATQITGVTHAGTINVSLTAGQSVIYEIRTPATNLQADIDGMLGADIVSTGNIVVNTGGQNIMATNDVVSISRDHGIDQIVPTDIVGRFYAAVASQCNKEKIYITATANNTDIFLNGASTAFTTINNGDYALIPASQFVGGAMYIEASKPVYVHHAICVLNDDRNQGLVFLPPLNGFAENALDPIPFVGQIDGQNFSDTRLRVIARVGVPVQVSINGGPPATLTSPQSITGTSFWEYYIVNPVTTGARYTFTSSAAIQVSSIGASGNIGFSSYHGGFENLPVAFFDVTSCDNLITVNSGVWDTYQWFFNETPIPGANSSTYLATNPGEYFAIVSLSTDPSVQQETNRITLTAANILDTDGDLLIDSCDLDDDNDGILDTEECAVLPNISAANFGGQPLPMTGINLTNLSSSLEGISYDVNFTNWDAGTEGYVDLDVTTSNSAIIDTHVGRNVIRGFNQSQYSLTFENINATSDVVLLSLDALKDAFPVTVTATDAGGGIIDLTGTVIAGTYLDSGGGSATWIPTTINGQFSTPGGGFSGRGAIINLSGLGVSSLQIEYTTNDTQDAWRVGLHGLGLCDTDMDGIPDHLDLDSDNDGCFDVVESGGLDGNNDGILDNGTATPPSVTVDANGQVNNGTGGYDGANGTETSATQVVVTASPSDQYAIDGTLATFSVTARGDETTTYTGTAPTTTPDYANPGNADAGLNYQWYLGDPDAGGTPIAGETNSTLNVTATTTLNGQQYCVLISHDDNVCIREVQCATLFVPQVELVKTGLFVDGNGDACANVGEVITYTFTVTNPGTVPLSTVTVTDPLLQAPNPIVPIVFVNGDTNGDNELDPGEVWTYTADYAFTQDDIDTGSVTNSATVDGTAPDTTVVSDTSGTAIDNDDATVTPLCQNPSISIIKTGVFNDENGDGFAQVGETISYVFTVTNTGDVTLTN